MCDFLIQSTNFTVPLCAIRDLRVNKEDPLLDGNCNRTMKDIVCNRVDYRTKVDRQPRKCDAIYLKVFVYGTGLSRVRTDSN